MGLDDIVSAAKASGISGKTIKKRILDLLDERIEEGAIDQVQALLNFSGLKLDKSRVDKGYARLDEAARLQKVTGISPSNKIYSAFVAYLTGSDRS